jgi:hypothetical protein
LPRAFAVHGLDRFNAVLAGHVTAGAMPGLVALVPHEDEVHTAAAATVPFDDPTPLVCGTNAAELKLSIRACPIFR